jgi:hypothetical protein
MAETLIQAPAPKRAVALGILLSALTCVITVRAIRLINKPDWRRGEAA